MLLKSKDDIAPQMAELEDLLQAPLPSHTRAKVLREKNMVRAGAKAEKEAAYQIDFALKEHKNWVVIHDLRLEHNGRVAQIDHLLFVPTWDFYVVETKSIQTVLSVEPGQWSFVQKEHWQGMQNPIEQNARHIEVLRELIKEREWLPRTMGIPVIPRFVNVVLVPSECLIKKQEEFTWVLHMDEFVTKARKDIHLGSLALNFIHNHTGEAAQALGFKLVENHRPGKIDYRKKFGIQDVDQKRSTRCSTPGRRECEMCRNGVSDAEVDYCLKHSERFAGKSLCRKCQSYAPHSIQGKSIKSSRNESLPHDQCAGCGVNVELKVRNFCRFNKQRFHSQILCRDCQEKVKA
ncbi:MAG TPA: nuclease-related domain-containing protein [Verrucomicrobiae bacterium]|jgi:hypothetical protein